MTSRDIKQAVENAGVSDDDDKQNSSVAAGVIWRSDGGPRPADDFQRTYYRHFG